MLLPDGAEPLPDVGLEGGDGARLLLRQLATQGREVVSHHGAGSGQGGRWRVVGDGGGRCRESVRVVGGVDKY